MNAHELIDFVKKQFTSEDIESIELVLEAHRRGVDITTLRKSSIWAVRVASTLIPHSHDLSGAKNMLSEWSFTYDINAIQYVEDVTCGLCGHLHCNVLFPIKNSVTEKIVHTGSRCILYFCETENLVVSNTYNLLDVDKYLKKTEAIVREKNRRIKILESIKDKRGSFWDSIRDLHSIDTNLKKTVSLTPMQAQYVISSENAEYISIRLRTKKQIEDAKSVFHSIKAGLRPDQLKSMLKKFAYLT